MILVYCFVSDYDTFWYVMFNMKFIGLLLKQLIFYTEYNWYKTLFLIILFSLSNKNFEHCFNQFSQLLNRWKSRTIRSIFYCQFALCISALEWLYLFFLLNKWTDIFHTFGFVLLFLSRFFTSTQHFDVCNFQIFCSLNYYSYLLLKPLNYIVMSFFNLSMLRIKISL